MEPGCSVVIPTRDCLPYLKEAIRSVIEQAFQPLELIVVDDGSTDGTGEWLSRLAVDCDELVALQGPAKGPASARNLAISKARYSHVAFLDADDIWYPGKLAEQMRWHFEQPNALFSFTDYRHVGMAGEDLGTCFEFWQGHLNARPEEHYQLLQDPLAALLSTNIVGTSSVVAKTEALRYANGFATALPSAEDWDLWLKLAEKGAVGISGTVTMDYLMRPGSETQKRQARIDAMNTIIARYEDNASPAVQAALKKARANILVATAEKELEEGNPSAALRTHIKAAMLNPDKRTLHAVLSDAKALLVSKSA
ncbi:glycosyltransferase family A protein [Pseudovibrio exalbescens]|uniref:glycosyltransferase family 2 protein n=1 Tax=Pseudovibrio exalbescens TaxID=197461 RepID=UPI0023655FF5|nr:glycosyltransferase family A protein [Pseudovibrio exalbescens]MDD7909214.1 glycosyltransferase family A protein [Pseudovibrio exalbescens]